MLSEKRPYVLRLYPVSERIGEVCIISVDIPGIFSLYSVNVSTRGFNIRAGSVFTGTRPMESPPPLRRKGYAIHRRDSIRSRRLIIDRFTGVLEEGKDFSSWKAEFETRLSRAYRFIMEASTLEEGLERAREELALEVAPLPALPREILPPYMYPVLVVNYLSYRTVLRSPAWPNRHRV